MLKATIKFQSIRTFSFDILEITHEEDHQQEVLSHRIKKEIEDSGMKNIPDKSVSNIRQARIPGGTLNQDVQVLSENR